MSKIVGHANSLNLNIGDWLSAKIYSDTKNGCPHCKSNDWKRVPVAEIKGMDRPVCANCGQAPDLYVIAATIEHEDGRTERIRVRNTQDGQRLKDIFDVVFTLRTVQREIDSNTFDVGKYLSKASRDSYRFSKIIDNYLEHHRKRQARGELSPAGFKDKDTLIRNHLRPFFLDKTPDLDVTQITSKAIRVFFNSYTDRLRMRDRATCELKTILKFAYEDGKLHRMPEFPEIEAAKMVSSDKFLTKEKQELVISMIENPVYRACIRTLAIYALRPCEVRALKWSDIDKEKGLLFIRSHISLQQEIRGRKSQKNKEHKLPIIPEFESVMDEMKSLLPRTINASDYIFKGSHGGVIGQNVLTRTWNDACKLAKVKGVSLYQGTKHSTLSNLGKTASDTQLRNFTGHTNTKIIHRYSQGSVEDIRTLLQ